MGSFLLVGEIITNDTPFTTASVRPKGAFVLLSQEDLGTSSQREGQGASDSELEVIISTA